MQHVFGPVASRRLGYSLGVEVIPSKTCSFSCVYCQVGKTTVHTDKRAPYVPTEEIFQELENALPDPELHYVTFSGSGEPTLHSELGKIIAKVKSLTDTPVCVITNSSLVSRKDVQKDLARADVVIPSLDSVIDSTFHRINRPVKGITPEKIINGLIKLRKKFTGQLWLEIMLVKGYNDSMEEVARLKEAVDRIAPDRVDLNTVVRPPLLPEAQAIEEQDMKRIAGLFGDIAHVIGGFDKSGHRAPANDMDNEVYELVRRRGITLADLVEGFNIHKDVAADILSRLTSQGKIKRVNFGGKTYYRENF